MTDYYYRGTSLQSAVEEELGTGRIEGFTANIYQGRIDRMNPDSTVARMTPIVDLDWDTPPGEDRGFLTKQQGVTGGLTDRIGTAIGFAGGVPIVLYLNRDGLNGTGRRVRYDADWFDAEPGALAWVSGETIEGEVRDVDAGLLGLTTDTDGGPAVWEWGEEDIQGAAIQYETENEVVVYDDHIDIQPACEAVGIVLEGRLGPTNALSSFDGYHSGAASGDGVDASELSERETLDRVLSETRSRASQPIGDLFVLNLDTTLVGGAPRVPREKVNYLYRGGGEKVQPDDIADGLLGWE